MTDGNKVGVFCDKI